MLVIGSRFVCVEGFAHDDLSFDIGGIYEIVYEEKSAQEYLVYSDAICGEGHDGNHVYHESCDGDNCYYIPKNHIEMYFKIIDFEFEIGRTYVLKDDFLIYNKEISSGSEITRITDYEYEISDSDGSSKYYIGIDSTSFDYGRLLKNILREESIYEEDAK